VVNDTPIVPVDGVAWLSVALTVHVPSAKAVAELGAESE
jgi:hypothetical protein